MDPKRRFAVPFGSRVIEPGSEYVGLVHNRPSNCLVAQFRRLVDGRIPVSDLYYRDSSASDFNRISKDDTRRSYSDVISCRGKPYVFFNAWGASDVGSDWVSICRVSLPDGTLAHQLDSGKLKLPSGCIRGWVITLLDANDEGTVLVCKVAFETETGPNSSHVDYSIRDLHLATGEHKLLAGLSGAFV
jgi:hypothetical protein